MNNIKLVLSFLIILSACQTDNPSTEGDAYYSAGNYEKAIESYTLYLNTEPRDIKSLYNRGRAYEEIGKYELALQDFNKIIKEDPLNVNAHLSITADYYYRKNDYENTIFYAEKVLKLDETNAMAFTLKGKGYQKLGQAQKALSAYNNAISVNSSYADAYISRGTLRLYGNKKNSACADFKVAQSLGSTAADKLIDKYCK